jgi:hypothetical protein
MLKALDTYNAVVDVFLNVPRTCSQIAASKQIEVA